MENGLQGAPFGSALYVFFMEAESLKRCTFFSFYAKGDSVFSRNTMNS